MVNINWADLVNRLPSSPSDFRIELRIAKLNREGEEIGCFTQQTRRNCRFFDGTSKISSCAAQTRSLRKVPLTALHVQFVSPITTHDVKIRCI
ncbi:hypothetical protein NC651_008770 [Populus alba x Populus x berolinensis]|nr:hypothetical protein NC651_008770 [Populus alba x Populus x berolinensis]